MEDQVGLSKQGQSLYMEPTTHRGLIEGNLIFELPIHIGSTNQALISPDRSFSESL